MAYNEKMADTVRLRLANVLNVEEKKMFRGITFMVNGKMCISVSENDMMCRIDPKLHKELIEKKGCRTMRMKDREYIGYVLINEEGLEKQEDFDYWVQLSLDFNKIARASKKTEQKNKDLLKINFVNSKLNKNVKSIISIIQFL